MRLLLVTLRTRAGSDEVSRRETLIEGDRFRVGRGVSMEINLPDIDIDFHHATITGMGGALSMQATGDVGLMVGGKTANQVQLSAGQEVQIGRFKFRAEPGRDGADAVLLLEEAPQAEHARRKGIRTRRRLVDVMPGRRLLGWVATFAVIGVFFVWPMADVLTREAPSDDAVVVEGMARTDVPPPSPMEVAWTSGEISKAHKMIENDCGACHQRPFEMTTNNACLACHALLPNHADPEKHPAVALEAQRCASCHKEHEGGDAPVQSASGACTGCHADIKAVSAESQLGNITDFGVDHTPFKLAVVVGVTTDADGNSVPQVEHAPFDPENPLSEGSGLRFPHTKHLAQGGIKGPGGAKEVLDCAYCHQQEAGGMLMRPIDMERDCARCHKMTFNAAGVERELPHADEDEVARIVRDYFIAAAMAGGVEIESAPAPVKRRRRQIAGDNTEGQGIALNDNDRQQVLEWATAEANVQMDVIMGARLCGSCHEATRVDGGEGINRWQVMPALLQRHWMPKAFFNHGPHEVMDCSQCHNAVESKVSSDVLMPGIGVCRDCHKGDGDSDTAKSQCVDCHEYHVPGRTPMSTEHAEIFRARTAVQQTSRTTE